MKNIVVIDTYPSNKIQEEILIKCINQIKPLGFDIMLVSHYPINLEIQKMVNLYIYDDKNDFLPSVYSPFFFMNEPTFNIKVFNGGHALPIIRNVATSLNLCKTLGYDFFYFMEFDILFGETDLNVLNDLKTQMQDQNKKMIFFKPLDFIECGSHVYETLFFGGSVDFFLEKFQPPINSVDWLEKSMGYTLEVSFFEKFGQYEDQYVIIPEHSHNYFTNSDVNVFRYGLFVCELLYNGTHEHLPCLFIQNSHVSPNAKHLIVKHNNQIILDRKFEKSDWWYNTFYFDNQDIIVYIFENERDSEHCSIKQFKLDRNLIEQHKNKGIITFS
jgi:hypothetical protein